MTSLRSLLLAPCRCGQPSVQHLAWGCREGHSRGAALCAEHAALTRAAIAGGLIVCDRCRKAGKERTVGMTAVDGKAVRHPWN